jgi:sugar lactone lactonase YvrE
MMEKISIYAEGLDHPECIAWHPDGSVWAGGEAGQIYRIDPQSRVAEEVANTGGFILGIAFSPDCHWLLICDLANKCLWRLDCQTRELSEFSKGAEGHTFNIPNYGSFDRKGNLYVSESGAFREVKGKILKYTPEGGASIWCDGPFNFANGLALDAKEEYLYVVCSFLPGIERIQINHDGTAGVREVVATLPQSVPDGMAFDADGNLLVSCYAPNKLYRITPERNVEVLCDDWEGHTLANPTNIAFGGENFDQLFTANLGRWHISKIDIGCKGLKLSCHEGI